MFQSKLLVMFFPWYVGIITIQLFKIAEASRFPISFLPMESYERQWILLKEKQSLTPRFDLWKKQLE